MLPTTAKNKSILSGGWKHELSLKIDFWTSCLWGKKCMDASEYGFCGSDEPNSPIYLAGGLDCPL